MFRGNDGKEGVATCRVMMVKQGVTGLCWERVRWKVRGVVLLGCGLRVFMGQGIWFWAWIGGIRVCDGSGWAFGWVVIA